MDVLILSKTHFGKNVCVGGMVLSNNQPVRLLNPGGWYQYSDTEFKIGDIWDIQFSPSSVLREPHNEDVIIQSKRYLRSISSVTEFILKAQVPIWRGSINNIFDSKLLWAKTGAGYLSENVVNYPAHSVGFWLSDKPLKYENEHYLYPVGSVNRKLKYKGIPNPISTIPANVLTRISLPKWWKPKDSDVEERCYVQISGWYDYNEMDYLSEPLDDLPY